jgi:hypothetical protein
VDFFSRLESLWDQSIPSALVPSFLTTCMSIDGFKPYHSLLLGKPLLIARGKNFAVDTVYLCLMATNSELAQSFGSSS